MGKFKGIDSREVKCCDKSETTIEAGISFDSDNGQNILRFHFLDLVRKQDGSGYILHQETKSMWLNKEATNQLIKALRELRF